jgi:U4/U6 small nuclear ribonucleoprotein PRP4
MSCAISCFSAPDSLLFTLILILKRACVILFMLPFQQLTLFFLWFCSSWSGIIKVWSMPQITKIATLKGHTERATDVAFSPVDNVLATASADKTAKLWNSDGSLLMSFNGHLDRLARLAFHPSGKYLGTASFDKTWRLWDINTGTELLLQEGHSRSVYGVSFHPDGSLAASCGLDAHARVWDLRSGRLYCTLIGHVKPVS